MKVIPGCYYFVFFFFQAAATAAPTTSRPTPIPSLILSSDDREPLSFYKANCLASTCSLKATADCIVEDISPQKFRVCNTFAQYSLAWPTDF